MWPDSNCQHSLVYGHSLGVATQYNTTRYDVLACSEKLTGRTVCHRSVVCRDVPCQRGLVRRAGESIAHTRQRMYCVRSWCMICLW